MTSPNLMTAEIGLQLTDVLRARQRIAPHVRRTPLTRSTWLSDATGADVWLKLESLQVSNSFKARGAFNAVMARMERHRPSALVTASAGNHGRALAMAAKTFGLPLTVFTPADAPQVKTAAIARLGAALRTAPDYDAAEREAKAFAIQTGGEFISAYNDSEVIAGAATIALEVLEDQPATNAFVLPIGGGGLISGVAAAAKRIDSAMDITGVEAAASTPFSTSLKAGRLVAIVPGPTLADGLAGNPDPDTMTFKPIQQFVDRIVTVTEEELVAAIVGLVDGERLIVEGAGAAAVAAVAARRVDLSGRCAAVVVSGANIDRARFASVIHSK